MFLVVIAFSDNVPNKTLHNKLKNNYKMSILAKKNGLQMSKMRNDEVEDCATAVAGFKGKVSDPNCKVAMSRLQATLDVYVDAIHKESTTDYTKAMNGSLYNVIYNYGLVNSQVSLALKKKDEAVKESANNVSVVFKRYQKTMATNVRSLHSSTISNASKAFKEVEGDIEVCGAKDFYVDMMSGMQEYKTYSSYREAVRSKKVNTTALKKDVIDALDLLYVCVNAAQRLGSSEAELAKVMTFAFTKYASITKARTTRNTKDAAEKDAKSAKKK